MYRVIISKYTIKVNSSRNKRKTVRSSPEFSAQSGNLLELGIKSLKSGQNMV